MLPLGSRQPLILRAEGRRSRRKGRVGARWRRSARRRRSSKSRRSAATRRSARASASGPWGRGRRSRGQHEETGSKPARLRDRDLLDQPGPQGRRRAGAGSGRATWHPVTDGCIAVPSLRPAYARPLLRHPLRTLRQPLRNLRTPRRPFFAAIGAGVNGQIVNEQTHLTGVRAGFPSLGRVEIRSWPECQGGSTAFFGSARRLH